MSNIEDRVKTVSPHRVLNSVNDAGRDLEKTVIVFGNGRGGTSALAGALRELGVVFSDKTHPLKHESSPVQYNPGGEVDIFATRLNLEAANREAPIWGWKSPQDIYSAPQFQNLVRNPHFLIVMRNMADIIESSSHHEQIEYRAVSPHIGEVQAELGRFIALSTQPTAVVSYERLIASPQTGVQELIDWLSVTPSDQQIENAVAFLSDPGRGYRTTAAYVGQAREGIAIEDIRQDQANAQASIYGTMISTFDGLSEVHRRHVVEARALEGQLRRVLAEKFVQLREIGGPDLSPLGELVCDLPLEDLKSKIEPSTDPVEGIGADPPPVQTTSALEAAETLANAARHSYSRAWSNYRQATQSRSVAQQAIDDLAFRIRLLEGVISKGTP